MPPSPHACAHGSPLSSSNGCDDSDALHPDTPFIRHRLHFGGGCFCTDSQCGLGTGDNELVVVSTTDRELSADRHHQQHAQCTNAELRLYSGSGLGSGLPPARGFEAHGRHT